MRQSLHNSPGIPDARCFIAVTDKHNITLYIDTATLDFHIDAPEDHAPEHLNQMLIQARHWGLEPLDPDAEDEAELLVAGMIRIQLTPMVPEAAWLTSYGDRTHDLLLNHGDEVGP